MRRGESGNLMKTAKHCKLLSWSRVINRVLGIGAILVLMNMTLVQADVITLAANLWPPYANNPGEAHPGFMIEFAKIIFERAGHTIEYQLFPRT